MKYREAIKCYKNSLLLDSTNIEAHFNLSNTYFLDKQYKESLDSYEKCKDYKEKKNQILFMQGRCYIELNDSNNYSKAEKIFEYLTGIEDFNKDLHCIYYKAILMEKMKNYDKAKYLYTIIMNSNPDFEDVENKLKNLKQ